MVILLVMNQVSYKNFMWRITVMSDSRFFYFFLGNGKVASMSYIKKRQQVSRPFAIQAGVVILIS